MLYLLDLTCCRLCCCRKSKGKIRRWTTREKDTAQRSVRAPRRYSQSRPMHAMTPAHLDISSVLPHSPNQAQSNPNLCPSSFSVAASRRRICCSPLPPPTLPPPLHFQPASRTSLPDADFLMTGISTALPRCSRWVRTPLCCQGTGKPRITTRYMTKYERARILGTRALQIRCGSHRL